MTDVRLPETGVILSYNPPFETEVGMREPPEPFSLMVVECPACGHGIDTHKGWREVCGVGMNSAVFDCATCHGAMWVLPGGGFVRTRETVGMRCPDCGWDYSQGEPERNCQCRWTPNDIAATLLGWRTAGEARMSG